MIVHFHSAKNPEENTSQEKCPKICRGILHAYWPGCLNCIFIFNGENFGRVQGPMFAGKKWKALKELLLYKHDLRELSSKLLLVSGPVHFRVVSGFPAGRHSQTLQSIYTCLLYCQLLTVNTTLSMM